ncbi:hypothetical protein [Gilvimarinus sp. DA14]|uniref:hypothetical protein n=1 Tax=Gilvimarinus sp. DA14 TaxID=2956798 RepID=UPI0020B891D7|nr:hypothetical protein [Gilvimarinus sp. DA14]UTF60597.1 hypothetical protein NHM04_02030 [Gilvimarinus sp. DA14]
MSKYATVFLVLALAACSNKAVYDNVQNDQRWRCDQEPISTQAECRERVSRDYEDYERERQEILEAE